MNGGEGGQGGSTGLQADLQRSLSARERNMLKRKAKAMSREGSSRRMRVGEEGGTSERSDAQTKNVIVEAGGSGDKIVMDQVRADGEGEEEGAEEGGIGESRWRMQRLCDQLLVGMFDAGGCARSTEP